MDKLKIYAYKDPKLKSAVTLKGKTYFEAPINPARYNKSKQISYHADQRLQNGKQIPQQSNIQPEQFQCTLIFDGTGIIGSVPSKPVQEHIDDFMSFTAAYNGDSHRIHYLRILWGELHFVGTLSQLQVDYNLFKRDGSPLRATLKVTFQEHQSEESIKQEENRSSPDLSHLKRLQAKQTLVHLTQEVYGKIDYLLPLAMSNQLPSLFPERGTLIHCPPLKA